MPRRKRESYKVFEKNVDRASAFLRIFDVDRTAGQPTNDEKELLRGAIVFAIGALDSFLHELVLEIVPTFGGDRSALKDAFRAIAKDDPGMSLRLALATDDETRKAEFRNALGDWLETKSFQGVGQVQSALQYAGNNLTLPDLDAATGTDTAKQLAFYTKMRHQIVHRGARPNIRRARAGECVSLVREMGKAINIESVKLYNS